MTDLVVEEAQAVGKRFHTLEAQRNAVLVAVTTAEASLEEARTFSQTAEQVRVFFQVVAEEQRKELEQRVQTLVDYGVQAVFGPSYRFLVKSELRGKAVRTEFFLVEDGIELSLLDATGGGVGDVVAFLLRVVMLCLSRPAQRRLLVLDEPFKFVSQGHFGRLEVLLRELTESLGLQLIMVTHRTELLAAATTVVTVQKTGGVSTAQVQQTQ